MQFIPSIQAENPKFQNSAFSLLSTLSPAHFIHAYYIHRCIHTYMHPPIHIHLTYNFSCKLGRKSEIFKFSNLAPVDSKPRPLCMYTLYAMLNTYIHTYPHKLTSYMKSGISISDQNMKCSKIVRIAAVNSKPRPHACIHTTCIHAYIHEISFGPARLFSRNFEFWYDPTVYPKIRNYDFAWNLGQKIFLADMLYTVGKNSSSSIQRYTACPVKSGFYRNLRFLICATAGFIALSRNYDMCGAAKSVRCPSFIAR